VAIFEHLDACVTPVLELSDLKSHPHHVSREFKSSSPMPAPRFSTQPPNTCDDILLPGKNSVEISKQLIGLSEHEMKSLIASKILIQAKL
jgi:alpha-methylacyl-CoA racemase